MDGGGIAEADMSGAGGIRSTRLRIALCLLCLLAGPAAAADFESPGPPPPAGPLPAEPVSPDTPPSGATPDNAALSAGEMVDRTHEYLERRIERTVVWFDNFFGHTPSVQLDTARPEFLLRWTNEARVEEGKTVKFRTSVRAKLHLPKLSRKLKLVVTGETKPDPTVVLPTDPGSPGFNPEAPGTSFKQVNTELRYEFLQSERTYLFTGAGVRLTLPVEYYARVRYQYNRPFRENNYFRFALTPFWKNEDGFGETTEFSLERRIHPRVLVGWANSGTFSEITPGLEWGTQLYLSSQLSARSAVSPSVGMSGGTRPHTVVSNYRVGVKYRRNDFRPWFFWELEPETTWPRDDRGSRKPVYAATLRVEILFLGD
jgi:hypothetical protein